jgi:YebC/PmpR family DNA-binding regulatory protein
MPKDTIERAIRRGSGGEDGVQYEEMRYEGYGPGGVAIIVEALTDNRNRTASEVRSSFSKYGGSLGETNSVSFMFDRKGVVRYPASVASADAMFEAALEAGADNVDSTAEMHEVTTTPEGFSAVRDALEERFGEAREARLTWMPRLGVSVGGDGAQTLFKLLEALEDNDDVQNVVANFEIAESDMARLIA